MQLAKALSQLFALNAECVRLHWSSAVGELPPEVLNALEIIEAFVENVVKSRCENQIGELSDEEMSAVISLMKQYPELKKSLGLGIVYPGEQAQNVAEKLKGEAPVLQKSLRNGEVIVIF